MRASERIRKMAAQAAQKRNEETLLRQPGAAATLYLQSTYHLERLPPTTTQPLHAHER